jgi:hypothetical protein
MINQILGVGPYKGYEIGFWGSNSNQNKLVTKPLSSENESLKIFLNLQLIWVLSKIKMIKTTFLMQEKFKIKQFLKHLK